MKYLIALMLLSSYCYADTSSNELILGSLTYHLIGGASESFQNKVSEDGRLIDNFIIGYQRIEENNENEYVSYAVFTGENSIAKPIGGFKLSSGVTNHTWYLGAMVGMYIQNNRDFGDMGIDNSLAFLDFKGTGLVPLAGMELNVKLYHHGKMYIKLNNIITPALTNHTVSIGTSF